jgi:hypothetical protein
MIKHGMAGLLFFDVGRELHVEAYNLCSTGAVVHADKLGLLPINFYLTFDGFLTVAKCRLLWRCRDDLGVAFERWIDIRQRVALDRSG